MDNKRVIGIDELQKWLTFGDLKHMYGALFATRYRRLAQEGRIPFNMSDNAGQVVAIKTRLGWLFDPSEVNYAAEVSKAITEQTNTS